MTRQTGVAIIGCGYWGPNYARIFNELPNCRLTWLCDVAEERLTKLRHVYPNAKLTRSHKDILHDSETEVVVVSSPASSHYKIVADALRAGYHVLVEKPTSTSFKSALSMRALARDSKLVLMTGYVYLSHPGILKAKELIDAGELGRIQYISTVRTGLGPIRSDVNALWDLAPHDLSIVFFLSTDTPKIVSCTGGSYVKNGIEDVVAASIKFRGGLSTHILVSWLAPIKERRVTIVGTKAMITFDDTTNLERLKLFRRGVERRQDPSSYGEFQLVLNDGDVLAPMISPMEPLRLQCQRFLDYVREGNYPKQLVELETKVMKTLECAQESLKAEGIPVGFNK
jgi:predicted dehydrogenase